MSEWKMSDQLSWSAPFTAPRPESYPQIPAPVSRSQWRSLSQPIPGPNPTFSDLLTATFIINTPRFLLKQQRRYGDHVAFFLNRQLFIGLFSPQGVHEVTVAQQHNFVKGVGFARMRKVLGEGLLTNEEPIHLAHRRMMQPPFHHKNLDGYVALMDQVTKAHLARWSDGKNIGLAPEMMELTLAIVARCLFGMDSEKYTQAIAENMEVAIDRIERTMLPGLDRFDGSAIRYFRRFEEASDRLALIAEEIIAGRLRSQQSDSSDLLRIMLQMRDEISMDHIRDEVLTLILSGHETTANVMTWAFSYLHSAPQWRDKLREEANSQDWLREGRAPTYAELEETPVATAILNETLRLAPPVWVAPRIAIRDCEIDGVNIPAGAHVLVSQYVTHRNPKHFPNPETFDPKRWIDPEFEKSLPRGAYFAFGGGTRKCLGEYFALAEARLILLHVASGFDLSGKFPKAQPRATYRPKGKVENRVTAR
jgi:cytochrome P450